MRTNTIEELHTKVHSHAKALELLSNKKLVGYLASPYTDRHNAGDKRKPLQHKRFLEVTHIGARLTHKYGAALIMPITTSHLMSELLNEEDPLGTEWDSWLEIDTALLNRADYIVVCMMDGYSESVGVKAEVDIAVTLGIPVIYLLPESLNVSHIHTAGGLC